MKTKYIIKGLLITVFLAFAILGCKKYDVAVVNELDVDRVFAPVGLKATVRNQTTVELTWTVKEDIDHYVVEFSADDPNFTSIFKSLNVIGTQLPIQVACEGETVYSIRVKAVSSIGLEDSKWAIGKATTLTEQIMLPSVPGDIKAKEATFRWIANSNVTHIVVNPGDINKTITAQEKAAGMATVTGLTGETAYTAKLMNNTKIRGTASFTTGIDIGTGILVTPTDDLFQKIADADAGAILVLEPGDYTSQTGTISLNKSLTIRGLRNYDKPKLKVSFSIITGAADVSLIDLDLVGELVNVIDVVRYSEPGNYNSLLVSGCNIHDFDRSFIAGNVSSALVNEVTVDNCIVTNLLTNGGDLIDFRTTNALKVVVKNSTFNNCAPAREFFRFDAAGASGTGLTTDILLDNCTLYKVSNASGKRIIYVRFNTNVITIKNTLFAETVAIYSNQSTTSDPTFLNNNYFNAPGLYTVNTKYDNSGTYTTLDPGFTNAASGNFKVTNQTLLDNNVGDPRWRQ